MIIFRYRSLLAGIWISLAILLLLTLRIGILLANLIGLKITAVTVIGLGSLLTLPPFLIFLLIFVLLRIKRNRLLKATGIDDMSFDEFLQFSIKLFHFQEYESKRTGKMGEQHGIHLVIKSKESIEYAVSCYPSNIPVTTLPVHEVISNMTYFDLTNALVITNSVFVKEARQLAKANGCLLIDRYDVLLKAEAYLKYIKANKGAAEEENIYASKQSNSEDRYETGEEVFEKAEQLYNPQALIWANKEALVIYQHAANMNFPIAFRRLGVIYKSAFLYKKAIGYFKDGINAGVKECYLDLADLFLIKKDYERYNLCWGRYFETSAGAHYIYDDILRYLNIVKEEKLPIGHLKFLQEIKDDILEKAFTNYREAIKSGKMLHHHAEQLDFIQKKLYQNQETSEYKEQTHLTLHEFFNKIEYEEQPWETFLNQAKSFFLKDAGLKENNKAFTLFKQAAAKGSREAYEFLGLILFNSGDFKKALAFFSQGVKLKHHLCYQHMANTFIKTGNIQNAIICWKNLFNSEEFKRLRANERALCCIEYLQKAIEIKKVALLKDLIPYRYEIIDELNDLKIVASEEDPEFNKLYHYVFNILAEPIPL